MQTKFLRTVFLLTAIALLLSVPSFADTQSLKTQEAECLDAVLAEPENETRASSSANPFKAYLVINTNSYAAPHPTQGYFQEVVPANTNIWIVEKVYCTYNNRYYYYAGYTYNSQSHRGYFCEDNVYYNGALLSNSNISDETKPANLKEHTSLAGTVYDGPGTSYATMGSVGQETIKLIRTEGDYNFIEYTVSSNNTKKRGYLHYSKITGSWANLTSQIASRLNGKTLYLKNRGSGQYLDVISWSTAENGRMQQYAFSGDPNQIFKFTYNSAGKYFTIQPANNYTSGRRLAINQASGTQHADKHLAIKTAAENTSQRFWIVEVGGGVGYKILPISGYGTMTLANRSGYINQYYTSLTNFSDTWIMESTEISTTATHYTQGEKENWCWLASAKCVASCENGFLTTKELNQACLELRGNVYDLGGDQIDRRDAANLFIDEEENNRKFKEYTDLVITEKDVRRLIRTDHAISLGLIKYDVSGGHSITLVKFKWIDKQGQDGEPGNYVYYYSDSLQNSLGNNYFSYTELCSYTIKFNINCIWRNTVVYGEPGFNITTDNF